MDWCTIVLVSIQCCSSCLCILISQEHRGQRVAMEWQEQMVFVVSLACLELRVSKVKQVHLVLRVRKETLELEFPACQGLLDPRDQGRVNHSLEVTHLIVTW